MKKEMLTHENIKTDILAYQKNRESLLFEEFAVCFVPAAISLLICFFSWIIGLLTLIYPAYKLIVYLRQRHALSLQTKGAMAGGYSIEKAKLVNIGEETVYHPHGVGKNMHSTAEFSFLYFEYQKWRIPSHTCYKWSRELYMSGSGICNTSIIGDEFYTVVLHNDNDICCVYNTKFFELPERRSS